MLFQMMELDFCIGWVPHNEAGRLYLVLIKVMKLYFFSWWFQIMELDVFIWLRSQDRSWTCLFRGAHHNEGGFVYSVVFQITKLDLFICGFQILKPGLFIW